MRDWPETAAIPEASRVATMAEQGLFLAAHADRKQERVAGTEQRGRQERRMDQRHATPSITTAR
jgi:hypothetical protein